LAFQTGQGEAARTRDAARLKRALSGYDLKKIIDGQLFLLPEVIIRRRISPAAKRYPPGPGYDMPA
jgi:hypothetical protein